MLLRGCIYGTLIQLPDLGQPKHPHFEVLQYLWAVVDKKSDSYTPKREQRIRCALGVGYIAAKSGEHIGTEVVADHIWESLASEL